MATVVRSTPETFSQSHLLRHFAPNNRHLFPIQVKVLEYDEPVAVLDSHQVEIGSVLVLHGWTRQPKVLATAGLRRFAVPLSYQGTFRVIARSLKTQSALEYSFQTGRKLRVVEANPDPDEGLLPVREGDVIVALGESVEDGGGGGGGGGASYIDCRKTDEHSGRTSGVFISSSWDITFEEIVDDLPSRGEGGAELFSIRDLASIVSDRSIDVELIRRGTDHPDPAADLPTNTPINLCKHVVEPAVYASLSTPLTPAFHISMRAPLYVRFVRQLPKSCSPLLTKQNAHISTLDRCVELLTPEVFHEVIVNHRRIMQLIQKPASNGGIMTLPTAGSRGRRRLSSSQSQVDLREMTSSSRKGPLSTTGSLSSRFKWKFSLKRKGNRSTGGSSRAGSDFGSIRSLPVTSRRKSDRFQFLLSSGDRLDTGHDQAYRRRFTLPPANPRGPPTACAANQNQELGNELSGRPIPSVTARLSQRKSTNKKQPSKTTIYEEVNGEETDEDARGKKPSADVQRNNNNSTEFRNRQEQTEQSEYERISTNRTSPGDDIQTNKISNQRIAAEAHSTNRTAQGDNASNHTTEKRSLTANQKQPSDYDSPRPRTNRQQLSVSGNDVTAKGFRRQGSLSSDARTSSVSDSVSSNDGIPHFRQPLNGTGSVVSFASNVSILKSPTSSGAQHQLQPHPPLPQNQLTHPQMQQPTTTPSTYQIPPGYALVPLNPNQAAIPPGFGIVPPAEMQQQQQPPALRQRPHHMQGDPLPHPPPPRPPEEEGPRQTNALAPKASSQTASDADTLREVSLNEGDDGVESEEEEEEEEEETLRGSALDSVSYSSNNGRILIPLDGNLISFSAKKFSQFLLCLNVDDSAIESCRKHRIDGRRFSRMNDVDLERRGLLHPVVLYFRKRTGKRTNNALFMH